MFLVEKSLKKGSVGLGAGVLKLLERSKGKFHDNGLHVQESVSSMVTIPENKGSLDSAMVTIPTM